MFNQPVLPPRVQQPIRMKPTTPLSLPLLVIRQFFGVKLVKPGRPEKRAQKTLNDIVTFIRLGGPCYRWLLVRQTHQGDKWHAVITILRLIYNS